MVRADEAKSLYADAYKFAATNVWQFEQPPKVIFCTTQESLAQFGLTRQAAITLGTTVIVISPCGWKDSYLRWCCCLYDELRQQRPTQLKIEIDKKSR